MRQQATTLLLLGLSLLSSCCHAANVARGALSYEQLIEGLQQQQQQLEQQATSRQLVELPAADMEQLLQLIAKQNAAVSSRGSSSADESRWLHFMHKDKQEKSHALEKFCFNFTSVNLNNNTPATTPAPATDTGGGTRLALPMQFFQTRTAAQLQAQRPVIDLQSLFLSNAGNAGTAVSGAASSLSSALAPGLPLVPVSLGNNAVGYVPLNLRMFRQLLNAPAVREGEDESTLDKADADVSEDQISAEEQQLVDEKQPEVAAAGARFPTFGQRLRQRNVNADATKRTPLINFAKNMRRVQYV